ncbi:hypothetical protein HanPI659440_Chr10g0397851 [Helianthus annuus]|nr:hypothetical protein HanPI659440_Chr10g0397851 [Helianthus annuus]
MSSISVVDFPAFFPPSIFLNPTSVNLHQIKSSVSYPGVMDYNYTNLYLKTVNQLHDYQIPTNITSLLLKYRGFIAQSELEMHLSAPMKWIGMYIALASLVCILAMVADLLHGFRSRKLWFPCTYFRINAAFLTVISVAMKLPLDLAGSMMGHMDRVAKLGSMAFMCTLMANLLPCLATMNNNELLSNITALCLLVVTLVVNVCIQIQTGVISTSINYNHKFIRDRIAAPHEVFIYSEHMIDLLASIYVICLGVLLILHVCSSLAILRSKRIIESKYQQGHDIASKDIQPSPGELLTIEKLHKHVSNHWIMAGSGSPQFITACFHTTSASSGVICLLVTILHTYTMARSIEYKSYMHYDSDYDSSMIVIAIVQYIGLVIGTVAPLSRWFATLSFKVSSKIIANHFNVFKVERYWTQKLYDWKHASVNLPFRSHNLEVVIETLKRLIFNICIGLQNGVVVICKVIALIPFLSMICFLYCFRCMKWLLKKVFPLLGNTFEKLEGNNDLRPYVLQLEDEIELGERTLKGLLKSVKRMIKRGATGQPKNLIKLILGKSTSSFEGVKKFDHIDDHDVPCVNCWRLPVVNLTTIAVSLPKIQKEEVDNLLESVREGLEYVTVVEKCLNATDDHVSFQNAAETLWREITLHKKWLGNDLHAGFRENTAKQIIEWFRDKAKNIACSEARNNDNTGSENDDLIRRCIGANSMYRITETILRNCHTNIDATVSQNELFGSLSSMIADIIAACLTNLPQAITMKCHTSVIEEREASVYDAAQLLGKTTQIIETLRGRDIPTMDPSDLPFIEKWRAYLGNP